MGLTDGVASIPQEIKPTMMALAELHKALDGLQVRVREQLERDTSHIRRPESSEPKKEEMVSHQSESPIKEKIDWAIDKVAVIEQQISDICSHIQ